MAARRYGDSHIYIPMFKLLLLCSISLSALSVNLRASQSLPSIDLFQPIELTLQLFGQAYDSTTQGLELQLLQMLYPDTATDVQAQLDQCEEDFWNSQVTGLQTINTDMWNLAGACAAEDPSTLVNQLVQDSLTLMATVTAQCDGLSVDLMGSINTLIATSIVQGYQFVTPWTGPLAQWTAASVAPLEVTPDYLQPVTQVTDSLAATAGVAPDTITQTDTDLSAIVTAWNTVLNNIAATGSLSADDISAALTAQLALLNDEGTQYGDVMQATAGYIGQAVQGLCSFVGPILSAVTPAAPSS